MIAMLAVAVVLVISAILLAAKQVAAYRASAARGPEERDLFVYSRRRLHIRLAGLLTLASIGVTLAVWELAAPLSVVNAQRVISILIALVVVLFVTAILDMRETAKTSLF